jgi:hypothetical protein
MSCTVLPFDDWDGIDTSNVRAAHFERDTNLGLQKQPSNYTNACPKGKFIFGKRL